MDNERKNSTILVTRLIAGILFIAGIMLLYFFGFPDGEIDESSPEPASSATIQIAPVRESLAPDFTLFNTLGEEVQLSRFKGQAILINFWATWCGPCRIEMPALQDRFERYQDDGLVVLAVDFDESQEDVAFFGEELGLTFELLLDPGGDIQSLYRIIGYPTSYFVDSQGIVKVKHIGIMTEDQLDDNLARIGIGN
jgi:peroxiredoxin